MQELERKIGQVRRARQAEIMLRAGTQEGSLVLPGGVSISRSLVEHWYGAELPGHWS